MSTEPTPADNDIPFDLAAKALKCSRRTIERMVERGRLERAQGAQIASVTRQSLVTALDGRNEAVDEVTRHSADGAQASGLVLLGLLDKVEAAQERAEKATDEATSLRMQLLQLEAAEADKVRVLDEREDLIEQLVNGTWRTRRAARRLARS